MPQRPIRRLFAERDGRSDSPLRHTPDARVEPSRPLVRPLQAIGGHDHVSLGSDSVSYKESIKEAALKSARAPELRQALQQQPIAGTRRMSAPDRRLRKGSLPVGGVSHVVLGSDKDGGPPRSPIVIPAAGSRVPERRHSMLGPQGGNAWAGVRSERPVAIRTGLAPPTSVVLGTGAPDSKESARRMSAPKVSPTASDAFAGAPSERLAMRRTKKTGGGGQATIVLAQSA